MTSRLRGPSTLKEGSNKMNNLSKQHYRVDPDDHASKSLKNGTKDNRYHFGMTKHDVIRKTTPEYKNTVDEDPDFLYRRSKEHFGAWDIKDIVQDENSSSKKLEERNDGTNLTNGKHKSELRDEGYVGSLPREHRKRTESADREHSKKVEHWESAMDKKNVSKASRVVKNNVNKEEVENRVDERDLSGEMDHLKVDSRSPDRRIRAMIERFKSREEGKLKSRRERNSSSPEKEEHPGRSKSSTRNDTRSSMEHSPDNWINDRSDRGRNEVNEREDHRRSSRHKYRDEEDLKDRRSKSTEKYREMNYTEKEDDPRRVDSFRQKSDSHNNEKQYRRRSKEVDDDQPRAKDNPKRRSYTYEGNPEDFDIRIQRYERALVEPRKDPEYSRRSSSRDRDQDLGRKDSLKDHERHISKKNSLKISEQGKKRESSLNRKSSMKDQENDVYRKNSVKNHHDSGTRYFEKDQEDESLRKNSFKDPETDMIRKSSFKEQNSDYGKILFKNRDDDVDRKNSFKEHHSGVSRITFKDCDSELTRNNTYKDDLEFGRVSLKEQNSELPRKNSFKEKTVEFAGISYKDDDEDSERRHSYRDEDNNQSRSYFKDYEERETSPNGRYVEFGKVSFRTEEMESGRSPQRSEEENEVRRKSSFKDRESSGKKRVSLRSKAREISERKSERHMRPLSPPKIEEALCKEDSNDRDGFSTKSWHESNKLFSAKYLREHSRFRTTPDGHSEVDHEFSVERSQSPQDQRSPRRSTLERVINNTVDEDKHDLRTRSDVLELGEQPMNNKETGTRLTSTHERNGATIIRIRAASEVDTTERRRRRRQVQDSHAERRRRQTPEEEDESEEDEEEDQRLRLRRETFITGRAASTPSRRLWNYREGGVLITDIEEGQPCLQCGGTCPGFSPHSWRKNCTSCKCPREAHDVCHEEWVSVRSRLGLKGEESSPPLGFDHRAKGLAWAPPGLPAHKVEEYFSMLPEISVPRLGTPGERHRDRQLAFQLPKQDLARAYCRHLNPKHASSADDFMAARNEIALDIGSVQEVLERDLDCGGCSSPLKYGSLAVSASKLGLLYHPACFQCKECKELLVDLAYCVHDDTLYCERHYAEQLKPRCAACDELIFSGEYTKAMNKDWHSGHFCCWQCDESLTGQRYVLRDEHPYCIKCYESVFANGCEECNKIIGIDSKDLSYKDKHWHEACFLCNRCRVSLVDKQFGSKVDKIYCGNCYDAQFASRCDGCGEIFRAGTKKMEYKTRQWHEKCFCCVVCKNPIGTKSFIPREQEIYCAGCYEDKFATRCVKCNKIITSGGVTYKNEPWHRDCFTCSNCNNSLAGQRFTSRDDKPYCADCFGELFAKRCTACSKPITGIGGTRFISFEDRHWHNDCFICAGCKTSLVGRGFITDGEDIICPDCAKMKLM